MGVGGRGGVGGGGEGERGVAVVVVDTKKAAFPLPSIQLHLYHDSIPDCPIDTD